MALVDASEENKRLVQQIEKLEEENRIYKEILEETRTFVEVLQVMLLIYCTNIYITIFTVNSIYYVFSCRNKLKMIGTI